MGRPSCVSGRWPVTVGYSVPARERRLSVRRSAPGDVAAGAESSAQLVTHTDAACLRSQPACRTSRTPPDGARHHPSLTNSRHSEGAPRLGDLASYIRGLWGSECIEERMSAFEKVYSLSAVVAGQ